MSVDISQIKELAEQLYPEVLAIRRHIHANPELSFEETETAAYISKRLTEWGISHETGVADTGLVGIIEGNGPGPTIALRADHDALPILEKNEVDYRSKNEGVMHACGHDVHTSNVLGAARILQQTKEQWSGRVKLIFQPGEEKLPGGASLMIAAGALRNPDVDHEIYLKVKGKGGHAAMPQKCIDPILISSHILIALQQVVSRHAHPTTPSVLSFGKINGHGATNVIPDEVKIEGTFRTFDEEWRMAAHTHVKRIAEQVATSMGGSCEVDIRKGYPFLKNNEPLTAECSQMANAYLGQDNVHELPLRMTAEDFSYYSQVVPACFYRLGTTAVDGSKNSPVHTPHFDIEEEALKTGMGLMAHLAMTVGRENT